MRSGEEEGEIRRKGNEAKLNDERESIEFQTTTTTTTMMMLMMNEIAEEEGMK